MPARRGQFTQSLSPFGSGRLNLDAVYAIDTTSTPQPPAAPPPRSGGGGSGSTNPTIPKPTVPKAGKAPKPTSKPVKVSKPAKTKPAPAPKPAKGKPAPPPAPPKAKGSGAIKGGQSGKNVALPMPKPPPTSTGRKVGTR